jgi:hypothetical protein
LKPAYGVLTSGKFRLKKMKAVLDNRDESADVAIIATRQLLVEEGLFGDCGTAGKGRESLQLWAIQPTHLVYKAPPRIRYPQPAIPQWLANSEFRSMLRILRVPPRRNMPLEKRYIRDGQNRIIGSVTSGFADESTVVRDEHEQITGRTSERFGTTRDERGGLVSTNTADAGLLINRKK